MLMIKQLLLVLSILSSIVFSVSVVADTSLLSSKQLIRNLQQGGYVIYFRHAATDKSALDIRPVELSHCDGQRNLSDKGREDAVLIGKTFRRLGIKITRVLSSPYCRCQDTARLAFGDYRIDDQLHFAISLGKQQRNAVTEHLKQLLAAVPEPGANQVVVSHTSNLKEATGIWPELEGGAYVFAAHPYRQGEAVYKGLIKPSEWGGQLGGKP